MKEYIIVLPNIQALIYGINSLTVQSNSKKQALVMVDQYLKDITNGNIKNK